MAIVSPQEKKWRWRIFLIVWLTYFSYYFCRVNMSVVAAALYEDDPVGFGFTEAQMGNVFSTLTICYAIGQFVNGQLGDRFGSRNVVMVGILGSVVCNYLVGIMSQVSDDPDVVLGWITVLWGINGFFQSMGWSLMVKALAMWFPLDIRGKVMGWGGTCYQWGSAFGTAAAIFLAPTDDDTWRAAFYVPATYFLIIGIAWWFLFRNSPGSVGLPPVADHVLAEKTDAKEVQARTLKENLIATVTNKRILIVAFAFFFLDLNRYMFVNWVPSYLIARNEDNDDANLEDFKLAVKLGIHPVAGSIGAVFCGWASDRWFDGRRAPMVVIMLGINTVSSWLFSLADPTVIWLLIPIAASQEVRRGV